MKTVRSSISKTSFFDIFFMRRHVYEISFMKKPSSFQQQVWVLLLLLNSVTATAYSSDVTLMMPEDKTDKLPIENSFGLLWIDVQVPPGSSVAYDLYFGTDTDPLLYRSGVTDGWTDGTANALTFKNNSDTTFFLYGEGTTLFEYNTTYYWKVVAKIDNGTAYSSEVFSFTTVRKNTVPSPPQITYPAHFAKDIPSKNLTLQWSPSTDPDNDPVTYKLYFGKATGNPPLIAEGLTSNSYNISFQLEDQATYFWKVEAVDGYDGSIVSTPITRFTIENYFNDPPTAPTSLLPDGSIVNIGKEVTFKWGVSSDKDQDEISYSIYVDDTPNPTTLVAEDIQHDQVTLYIEEAYNRKYWKVVATDGVNTTESQVLSYIPYERPKAPELLIKDQFINIGRRPRLQWTQATPNPDEVIYYDLYLDKNPSPTTLMAPGLRENFFEVAVKEAYATYYWKVITRNESGVLFESPVQSFTPWKNDHNAIQIEMIDVDGGEFSMGHPELTMLVPGFETWGKLFVKEITPQRTVFLDDFSMAKYEITYAQFLAFLNATKDSWYVDADKNRLLYHPGILKMDNNGHFTDVDPVALCHVKSDAAPFDFKKHSKLTWDGSQLSIKAGFEQYPANWLTIKGMELFVDWADKRLPSEAEWEYAARGGNQSQGYTYSGSNNASACAWFLFGDVNLNNPMTGNNFGDPSKNNKGTNIVGLKAANELGLHDLSGNVRELCSDYYREEQYFYTEYFNPQGPTSGTIRAARGGSYEGIRSEIMTRARNQSTQGITGIRTVAGHSQSTTILLHGIVRNEHEQVIKGISLNSGKSMAITTQSGRYQLRVNKDEPMVITPSHPDYIFSPSSIVLEGLDRVTTGLNFTAYLKREVKISGTVTDQNGKGVNRVRIKGVPDEVYTDRNGHFSIQVPKNTEYAISTELLGYRSTQERVVSVVQSNVPNTNFTMEHVGYATLRGKVTKQNGNPINNIWISGLDQGGLLIWRRVLFYAIDHWMVRSDQTCTQPFFSIFSVHG